VWGTAHTEEEYKRSPEKEGGGWKGKRGGEGEAACLYHLRELVACLSHTAQSAVV